MIIKENKKERFYIFKVLFYENERTSWITAKEEAVAFKYNLEILSGKFVSLNLRSHVYITNSNPSSKLHQWRRNRVPPR